MLDIIDAQGNKKSLESALNLERHTGFGIDKALWQSGKDLISTFNKQVLSKDKSGRIYIRRDRLGRGRRHASSGAGESPANRTGFYRKSAGFNLNRGAKELAFGASAPYAGFLELGTTRMKPRPGLGNAVNASERDILRNFSSSIQGEL